MKSASREQSLLPLPDFSRKIEGDSARRVQPIVPVQGWTVVVRENQIRGDITTVVSAQSTSAETI